MAMVSLVVKIVERVTLMLVPLNEAFENSLSTRIHADRELIAF